MKNKKKMNFWDLIVITNIVFCIIVWCIIMPMKNIKNLEEQAIILQEDLLFAQKLSMESDTYLLKKIEEVDKLLEITDNEIDKQLNINTEKINDVKNILEEKLEQRIILSEEEIEEFGKLVMAESGGESFEAQKAVASTIINRIIHQKFPDTFNEVMYQKNAFSVTFDGSLGRYETSQSVKDAVTLSLFKDYSNGSQYFLNEQLAIDQGYEDNVNQMINSLDVTIKIGEITFLKEK